MYKFVRWAPLKGNALCDSVSALFPQIVEMCFCRSLPTSWAGSWTTTPVNLTTRPAHSCSAQCWTTWTARTWWGVFGHAEVIYYRLKNTYCGSKRLKWVSPPRCTWAPPERTETTVETSEWNCWCFALKGASWGDLGSVFRGFLGMFMGRPWECWRDYISHLDWEHSFPFLWMDGWMDGTSGHADSLEFIWDDFCHHRNYNGGEWDFICDAATLLSTNKFPATVDTENRFC